MGFLASDAFITIVSVVVSVAGLLLALRADIGRRIDRLEERSRERDQALEQRIKEGDQALGQRIDRLEDRTRADHLELVAEISQLKTAVSVQVGELNAAVSAQTTELKTAVDAQIGEMKTAVDAQIGEMKTAMSAQIGELNAAVGVLGTKLDERSAPRRLVVQEPPGDYSVDDESEGGPEP